MSDLVVLVPVLARPQNAAKLVLNIRTVSHEALQPRILFLCSKGDHEEISACEATAAETVVVPWVAGPGDWARKLEYGRAITTESYMVLAADDLCFHKEWDRNALHSFTKLDIGVLGTQDKGNPLVKRGLHSTHPIVCRGYADEFGTIDDPTKMVSTCYDHQYVDNELCQTAIARGCWHFARDVVIEHLHPAWGKAEVDATYEKGWKHGSSDNRLFVKRSRLWNKRAVAQRHIPGARRR
jgi:hypothetical protein